jgi:hypothetical protein
VRVYEEVPEGIELLRRKKISVLANDVMKNAFAS